MDASRKREDQRETDAQSKGQTGKEVKESGVEREVKKCGKKKCTG